MVFILKKNLADYQLIQNNVYYLKYVITKITKGYQFMD